MDVSPFYDEYIEPRGLTWDRRFLELAKHVSTWSKDPSTKVGAVIVDLDRVVLGMGYNGFPRHVHDDEERYLNRELKYSMIVHAEVNAIHNAKTPVRGGILYVYPSFHNPPACPDCCKHIIQSGISQIVSYRNSDLTDEQKSRWSKGMEISKMMLDEAKIVYRTVEEEK